MTFSIRDAPLLSGGKNPRYDEWAVLIRNKLRAHAEQMPTPDLRLAYVSSRCTDLALMYITPRMRQNAELPYTDVDELMEHLEEMFGDRNRLNKCEAGVS